MLFQFLFHRQFCSWVSSHLGHPCCILTRGRIFWTVKFLQTIQHQCSKRKESTAISREGRFSPTPHKWQQESAQLGLCPIDWWWQEVNGGSQNHLSPSMQPLLAGCGTVPAWEVAPLPGYKKEAFTPIPETLQWSVFLPCQPWMVSLPPQTTGQAVPPGALCVLFQAGSSAWGPLLKQRGRAVSLIWSCCPVFPEDRTHLTQQWACKVPAGQLGK